MVWCNCLENVGRFEWPFVADVEPVDLKSICDLRINGSAVGCIRTVCETRVADAVIGCAGPTGRDKARLC
jgi:hypothetical protein